MSLKNEVQVYGPLTVIARVRWAPSSAAVQTLTDSVGVATVTRSGAGAYSVNLLPGLKAVQAMVQFIEDDTTNHHWAEITALSTSAVSVRHRTALFANVTSAPTASDTVDQLQVLVWGRIAS